jgi:hypothetical protein
MIEAVFPLPHYDFMMWYLIKHRDNFTLAFLTYSVVKFDKLTFYAESEN